MRVICIHDINTIYTLSEMLEDEEKEGKGDM